MSGYPHSMQLASVRTNLSQRKHRNFRLMNVFS